MVSLDREYFKMWVLLGAIGGAIGLLVLSMVMYRKFPTAVYFGFLAGWSIVGIGLSRVRK